MSALGFTAIAVGLIIVVKELSKLAAKHQIEKFKKREAISDYLNKE